ncbi:MAG: DNA repair protein RecO, partial [Aeromicrobium sp.]
MSLYRDQAVVLRTHKLGEADRIITLLMRDRGLVRAVARGVRKTSSRFGGRLEPFMNVDLQLAEGRTLDIITQVETLSPFAKTLGGSYPAYTAGTAMLETAERLVSEDGEPAVQQYLLLVSALRALSGGLHIPGLILDSYQLRALSIAGYAPTFSECAQCSDPGPHRAFHAPSGGILCDNCRAPGSASPS